MSLDQNTQPVRYRYRIHFGKDGALRYTSHLDLARIWERLLRRAGLALAYSQGFNPRPKIQLAAALPLGYASRAEVLDVWLDGKYSRLAPGDLRQVGPDGLTITSIEEVALKSPALQAVTDRASYQVVLKHQPEELQVRITGLLAQGEIVRVRRKKSYDLRPLIHELKFVAGHPIQLEMKLALSQKKGTGRPDEVLDALGLDALATRITRTAIIFVQAT